MSGLLQRLGSRAIGQAVGIRPVPPLYGAAPPRLAPADDNPGPLPQAETRQGLPPAAGSIATPNAAASPLPPPLHGAARQNEPPEDLSHSGRGVQWSREARSDPQAPRGSAASNHLLDHGPNPERLDPERSAVAGRPWNGDRNPLENGSTVPSRFEANSLAMVDEVERLLAPSIDLPYRRSAVQHPDLAVPLPGRDRSHAETAKEVHVRIGRIEVTAVREDPTPPSPPAERPRTMSLDDYLASRRREGR